MKPQFDTDFEYDQWEEEKSVEQILDNYYGDNDVEVHV